MILEQKYSVGNTRVDVMSLNPNSTFDKLPTNIYSVRKDQFGFHLEILKPRFNMPEKLYGKTNIRTAKIMNTYNSRTVSTGVLMTGDKGSGKTLLSESICNASLDSGIPVVMVTEPHIGEAFNTFINSLGEIVLFFDEFGKTYSSSNDDYGDDSQSSLLTLFDGAHSKKRLILVTENKEYKIDEFMKNRPGRLYYHFRFDKLENDVIEEYSIDTLAQNSEDFISEVIKFASRVGEFSFDVLKAIIEERNRYCEDLITIISELNIAKDYQDGSMLKIISVTNHANQTIELDDSSKIIPELNGNSSCIYFAEKDKITNKSYIYISKNSIKASKDNKFIYSTDGYTVIAEKITEEFNLNKYNNLF